jgi:CBS domain-containing protein
MPLDTRRARTYVTARARANIGRRARGSRRRGGVIRRISMSDPREMIEIEPGPGEPPPVPTNITTHLPPRRWPPAIVADLMTRKLITMEEGEAIGDLEGWMARFRFRHLPVVRAGALVGIITRTDVLHAALGTGPDGKPIEKAGPETKAGAIMNRNVITAQPDAPLTIAARVMFQEKLSCLPVVLPDGTLVGLVTESDLARLALELMDRHGM